MQRFSVAVWLRVVASSRDRLLAHSRLSGTQTGGWVKSCRIPFPYHRIVPGDNFCDLQPVAVPGFGGRLKEKYLLL